MLLPRWQQRKERRRAMDLQCAAIDQEIGSRLDDLDRLDYVRTEVLRLRRGAQIVSDTPEGGQFAKGAIFGYDRVIELLDGVNPYAP